MFLSLKMKISSIGRDAVQIQIDEEDYSVADIIHKELLAVKHVKFAGVAPPHPLLKTLTIQLHTDGEDANELLEQAVGNAQKRAKEILDAAKKEFPDALKPVGTRPVPEHPPETPVAQPQPEQKADVVQAPSQDNAISASA
jgi:DNA-directed RNA polymerase subunit L